MENDSIEVIDFDLVEIEKLETELKLKQREKIRELKIEVQKLKREINNLLLNEIVDNISSENSIYNVWILDYDDSRIHSTHKTENPLEYK